MHKKNAGICFGKVEDKIIPLNKKVGLPESDGYFLCSLSWEEIHLGIKQGFD